MLESGQTHSSLPKEFGDPAGGFKTVVDQRSVRIVAWGFWSVAVAGEFHRAVLTACTSAPEISSLHFDMTLLKPMRDEGQEGFGNLMGALPALEVSRVTILVSSPLTRLQLLRIAREKAPKDLVQFIETSDDT